MQDGGMRRRLLGDRRYPKSREGEQQSAFTHAIGFHHCFSADRVDDEDQSMTIACRSMSAMRLSAGSGGAWCRAQ
ncbi:MAG: hypothetical protein ACLP0B_12220, partial [Steroidobacteraceae bacterium]